MVSPNAEKYGPEKLQIRALFTQCSSLHPLKTPEIAFHTFIWY